MSVWKAGMVVCRCIIIPAVQIDVAVIVPVSGAKIDMEP